MDGTLQLDQSSITGEDDPVEKQVGDICYSSTGLLRGSACLIVVGTGYQTFVGRTMALIEDPMPDRRPQGTRALPFHVTDYLGVLRNVGALVCALVLAPFAVHWIIGSMTQSWNQILQLGISLAIVAIPASMNVVISAYRGRGVQRLCDSGALVNGQLTGVEALAGIDILCSDKTGTITQNKLTIMEPYKTSCDKDTLMLTACLSNSPDKEHLDPIDQAIHDSLERFPQAKAELDRYKIVKYQPFDMETKRAQTLVESRETGERVLCVKGAPRAVLETYLQDHPEKEDIKVANINKLKDFADRGLRSLAIARKRGNKKWELLGLIPFSDPPRSVTPAAVKVAKTLGVSVKIFTGDATTITKQTAQTVDMGTSIIDGKTIGSCEEAPSPEIVARVENADAYAEVFPSHKEKVIRALQSRGHLVGVTGDGIEDVPSLRRADCGIAVEGATEKAQSAADVIFNKNPGLASIICAIQISRQTFQQVYNYVVYRTSVVLHLMLVTLWWYGTYAEVLDVRFLVLDVHVSDIVALALVSSNESTPVSRKPQRWSFSEVLTAVLPLTIALTTGTVIGMWTSPNQDASTRTQILFLHHILSDHWIIFLTHTNGRFSAFTQRPRVLVLLLCVDVLASLLCVRGWAGQAHGLSVEEAVWAWVISLGTLGIAAGLRWMTFDGMFTNYESCMQLRSSSD